MYTNKDASKWNSNNLNQVNILYLRAKSWIKGDIIKVEIDKSGDIVLKK
jgi:hypothetical protein